jgi:hypothetical protein
MMDRRPSSRCGKATEATYIAVGNVSAYLLIYMRKVSLLRTNELLLNRILLSAPIVLLPFDSGDSLSRSGCCGGRDLILIVSVLAIIFLGRFNHGYH